MSKACIALFAFAITACGLPHYARTQFTNDHAGCAPDTMRERPDFVTPNTSAVEAWEMTGCNVHELYTCESGGYTPHGRAIPPTCTSKRWCETPGCATDYAGVARSMFVTAATCPSERITAGFTSTMLPSPPPEIATDEPRAKLWHEKQRLELDGASAHGDILITTNGCGAVGLYRCENHAPSAPACYPSVAIPELATVTATSPPR